jgi:hypothetical protein
MRGWQVGRFLIGLFLTGAARGHQIEEIPMSLAVGPDRVVMRAEVDAAYMLPEFRGDSDEEPKDMAWLRGLGRAGWREIDQETEAYWRDCLRLEADGRELEWRFRIPAMEQPDFPPAAAAEDLPFLSVEMTAALPVGARELAVVWREPYGVNLIVTTGDAGAERTHALVSGERRVLAAGDAGRAGLQPAESTPGQWFRLGFIHILPFGVDHVLFVVGLFLFLPKWQPLLRQTLVFTLAHSLTLAAATLGWLRLPERPVEIVIAASIAWIGIENLRGKDLGRRRLWVVGVFGLIHGLGFAGVLAELLPAGRPDQFGIALLGFNLGVEAGQLVVLAVAFGLCGWWKDAAFQRLRLAGSAAVALAGLVLVAERCLDRELLTFL